MSADVSKSLETLMELAAMRDEELHPDLVPYETVNGLGMRMLAHPLVHDILPLNGHANRVYAHKKAALAAAIEAEDWHTAVFLHEKPYRCGALIDYVIGRDGHTGEVLSMAGSDEDVRDLVASVWTDSENIHQHVDDWLAITEGHVPGEPLLMGEQDEFDALPTDEQGRIEVWRGDCDDGGWSWTLDKKIAEFFCARWGQNNDLLHGYVDKRNVFGYLTSRSEAEVMVRREHVEDIVRTVYG